MHLSIRPQHLARYKDIALLFIKYGHGGLLAGAENFEEVLPAHRAEPVSPDAQNFAADLEKLGPTFIKFGQLLSTRVELLPATYRRALERLQDHVEPFSFEEVEAIIPVEIGARISKAFTKFDSTPLAAASLGQVHRATLRDGREVAVKIQRPHIRERMMEDIAVLGEAAQLVDAHTELGRRYAFSALVEQFRKSLLAELDYRQEAQNMKLLGEKLRGFQRLVIPQPIDDYTTSRVLTMPYISGTKITDINPVVRLDIDGEALAAELFKAYLQQILVDGFFHADPHPGNILLTHDHRIALIDIGMVGRIAEKMQENLLQLLFAISEGRADDAASSAIKIGNQLDDFDELEFRRRISEIVVRQKNATVEQMQVGRIVLEVTQISAECRIRVPPELSMLGKTLLNLDLVGRALDADFDANAAIRNNAAGILQNRLLHSISPGSLFSSLVEIKDLFQRLPERVNRILDSIATNRLKVKVDTIDEAVFMAGLQKIANRITMGLVIASLIIGAALLMRVETHFRIFGYPGFAMICFVVAIAAAGMLLFNILRKDDRR